MHTLVMVVLMGAFGIIGDYLMMLYSAILWWFLKYVESKGGDRD